MIIAPSCLDPTCLVFFITVIIAAEQSTHFPQSKATDCGKRYFLTNLTIISQVAKSNYVYVFIHYIRVC